MITELEIKKRFGGLHDESGDILWFILVNKSHRKTKTNDECLLLTELHLAGSHPDIIL